MTLLTENKKNKEIEQNNKSREELSQIRDQVKKYKSMGDDQCLDFLEDLWVQKTEISSAKSEIIQYLQFELGQTYFRLRRFGRSQSLFHDLWKKQKEVFGENHLATLQTELYLGQTYAFLNRFEDALTVFQDLVEKQSRILGKDYPSTLSTEFFLGQTYKFLNRFEDAVAVLQDVANRQRRVLGKDHLATLDTESLLAQTYLSLSRFEDALAVFQDVANKQRRVLGENHPTTLSTEAFLGQTYGFLNRFEDALTILQDLVERQRRVLGENHPTTLNTESFLGQVYLSHKRVEDALTIFQDLVERQHRVLGENHPTTQNTEFFLGQTYGFLNRFEDALAVFQDLTEKQRRILGESHLTTLNTEFFLGQAYGFLNRFEDALAVFQDVANRQRRALGENHPTTLSTESLLGQTYLSLNQFEDALAVLQNLIKKQHHVFGEEHLATLRAEFLLGQTYLSLNQFEDALAVLQNLIKKQHHVFGEEHLATLRAEFLLGQTYLSLNRFEDALAVFQDLVNKQRRVLGKNHLATLGTELILGQTYLSLKRFEDALAVFQDLVSRQRRVLGEEDPATLSTEFFLGQTYLSLKQFKDALATSQGVLEKQRRVLGEKHLATMGTESLLGIIYHSLNRLEDALTVFQDLLSKQRDVFGEEHPTTLSTEFFLGQTYLSLKQFKDALTVLQDLVEKQRRILGENHLDVLSTESLLGIVFLSLNQLKDALAVFHDLVEKQRRILGENHPVTLRTDRSIKEISNIDFENKQQSSFSGEDMHLESTNFDFPSIPDYKLISRFQQYDYDFSRSKVYSEQTGVPLVDSSDSHIPNSSKGKLEDVFLEVKNFLNLGHVQLNIKPIMCVYGKNQVGKSNISRLLYGFQHSSTKIAEKLKGSRYSKRIRSLSSELNTLKSKFAEASVSKDRNVRFTIPEEVRNLLVGRLSILIEEQISEIPSYFYPSDKSWKKLIGNLKNDGNCLIHTSRSSFSCDVKVNAYSNDPIIEINLEPKNSFKIEIELVYESDERNLLGTSIFEVIYNLSSLRIHLSDRYPISIPLKKINLSDNLEHLPILHHVMHFSDISYISDQDSTSLKYEETPRIINNSEMVSKEELDILDNRLVYLIYDTLLIELWKMSPFSFFAGDARFFPAERGGILERMQTYVVRNIFQEEKVPEGLKQYSRLIEESLSFLEENRNEAISKLSIQNQNLLREIESDLIDILYHLELKVSQDIEGAPKHVFVKKNQGEGKEDKREFVLSTLPSSVFSLFALNLHIRLSKLKMMLFYEEPETHLHPSSIEKLCDLLVKMYLYIQSGEEHNLAMLFTTHSGFFLNFLFLALERKYELDKIKEILSVVRLFTDKNGNTESEAIMITEEGYSESPFDEEELKIYEDLTRLYNKYVTD